MSKCKKCGTEMEMYYVPYCPKCDIQDIIKEKHGSIAIIPVLNYGKKYIKGFNKDTIWDMLCERDNFGNDTYIEYYFEEDINEVSKDESMLKQVLDELGIKYKDSIFLWVSW